MTQLTLDVPAVHSTQYTVHSEKNKIVEKLVEYGFEKLKVYQIALDFVDDIFDICSKIPLSLQCAISDQFRRAALSITNNIAEGSDKESERERRRYYSIARDAARECASMCIVLYRREAIDITCYSKLRVQLRDITSMLAGLVRSTY